MIKLFRRNLGYVLELYQNAQNYAEVRLSSVASRRSFRRIDSGLRSLRADVRVQVPLGFSKGAGGGSGGGGGSSSSSDDHRNSDKRQRQAHYYVNDKNLPRTCSRPIRRVHYMLCRKNDDKHLARPQVDESFCFTVTSSAAVDLARRRRDVPPF